MCLGCDVRTLFGTFGTDSAAAVGGGGDDIPLDESLKSMTIKVLFGFLLNNILGAGFDE